MAEEQSPFDGIKIRFNSISLPYSYRELAAECFKQCSHMNEVPYLLAFMFLHMHLDGLLFEDFVTIQLASRGEISTQYPRCKLRDYIRNANKDDLIKRMRYLEGIVKPAGASGIDTSLLSGDEEDALRAVINIRDFLVHAKNMGTPPMGLGGQSSQYPLQYLNAMEDLEAAFRLTIVLEHRLLCVRQHIRSSLFDHVCIAHTMAERMKPRAFKSFTCYVFKSPEGRFRSLVSQVDFPVPRLSTQACRWNNILDLHDCLWPVQKAGEYRDSLEAALEDATRYVSKRWKGHDFPPFEKTSEHAEKPIIRPESDWPWIRHTLQDAYTTHYITNELLRHPGKGPVLVTTSFSSFSS